MDNFQDLTPPDYNKSIQNDQKNRAISKFINNNYNNSPYPQLENYTPRTYSKMSPIHSLNPQPVNNINGNSFSNPPSEINTERSIEHSPLIQKKVLKEPIDSKVKKSPISKVNKKKLNEDKKKNEKQDVGGYANKYKKIPAIPKLPIINNSNDKPEPIKPKKDRKYIINIFSIAREMAKRAIEVEREQKLKEKGYY